LVCREEKSFATKSTKFAIKKLTKIDGFVKSPI